MIKAVLFDLDGTLLDTARDLVAALNHVRAGEGMLPLEVASLAFAVSRGAAGLIEAGMPAADAALTASRKQQLLDYYSENPYTDTIPFSGVEAMLAALDASAMPWGVVTNKHSRFTQLVMQASGLAKRSACLVCGDTLARAKPWPDQLLLACERLKIKPENTMYIGDDQRDMQAAEAAGMPGYHVSWGYGPAASDAAILQSPAEIIDLLQ
ncbi:MAG: HAD-IA family hydrolase [Xanthomonadales bacterium]|nr:HAD-IA family hydrolase [Xanthomonadales bacterium]